MINIKQNIKHLQELSKQTVQPNVAIIILNWNGWQDTIECLESLQRITYSNYQVIVVDNGSTDDSMNQIKAWARGEISVNSKFFEYDISSKPVHWVEYDRSTAEAEGIPDQEAKIQTFPLNRRLVLIQTGENFGFAGGNNVGIKCALENKADYVWLLNNDTVVDSVSLTELLNAAKINPNIGMAGAKIYYYAEPKKLWHAGGVIYPWKGIGTNIGMGELDCGQHDKAGEVDYITGCSLLVSRRLIEEIGTLDERYFLYYEETDWAVRATNAGWKVVYTPSSKVWHKIAQSLDDPLVSMSYYFIRNSLLFTVKNYPWLLPIVLIWSFRYSLINHIFKGRWKHLKMSLQGYFDFFFGRYGVYTKT